MKFVLPDGVKIIVDWSDKTYSYEGLISLISERHADFLVSAEGWMLTNRNPGNPTLAKGRFVVLKKGRRVIWDFPKGFGFNDPDLKSRLEEYALLSSHEIGGRNEIGDGWTHFRTESLKGTFTQFYHGRTAIEYKIGETAEEVLWSPLAFMFTNEEKK